MGGATENRDFTGLWTAIATPFTSDFSIDWPAFEKLLQLQAQAKVKGIVVSGTTGEAPTLERAEKLDLIRKARKILPASVRVMAGAGGNSTKESVALSQAAVEAGADSLLIVTPPYNKPTVAGLVQHFTSIAQAAPGIPICLYHVPGRTAQLLNAEAIAEICKVKGVLAVKEASADLALFTRALLKSKSCFLSGDDPTYLPSLSVGGSGCISVASNVYPGPLVKLYEYFKNGESQKAQAIHNILFPVFDVMICETNPGPLKAALEIKKISKNILRQPLAAVSAKNYSLIKDTLSQADALLSEMQLS